MAWKMPTTCQCARNWKRNQFWFYEHGRMEALWLAWPCPECGIVRPSIIDGLPSWSCPIERRDILTIDAALHGSTETKRRRARVQMQRQWEAVKAIREPQQVSLFDGEAAA